MHAITFFKNLADQTRLTILLLISVEQELCVCELCSALELSQPKISRHLALLKAANILTSRRQGQWIYYSLNSSLPTWCITTLQSCNKENPQLITKVITQLNCMGDRPQRQQQCCNT
ncbi:metalloregulator ArsR/SmtB family transcription factor [Colwelliaceae bacterium BS250]